MPAAGEKMGISGDSAKRALARAGVPLVQINSRAYAVEERDLKRFIEQREAAGYSGRGRPPGSFKVTSPRSKAHKEKKESTEKSE
jgi:hypothetical protein